MGRAAGNASEAARIAGYAFPGQEGHRLLKDAEVAKWVQGRAETDPLSLNRDERQRFLTRVVMGLEAGFDNRDRMRAIELLCRSNGDFLDRIHQTVEVKSHKEELARVLDRIVDAPTEEQTKH